jgi:protein-S-isoprenylcysteine O-methyltransferase Ste14
VIARINFGLLIASVPLFLFFYVRSVGPAALEARIGERAYSVCARYRLVAGVIMGVASVSYVIYGLHPLPVGLPRTFVWPWMVSVLLAAAIAAPAGYLWYLALREAGTETMIPKKEHVLYGGIYQRIRHPQAVAEMPFFWVLGFLLHSPFLVLFSFVWIPVFVLACLAEERDLIIRYGRTYEEYRQRTGFIFPRWR